MTERGVVVYLAEVIRLRGRLEDPEFPTNQEIAYARWALAQARKAEQEELPLERTA